MYKSRSKKCRNTEEAKALRTGVLAIYTLAISCNCVIFWSSVVAVVTCITGIVLGSLVPNSKLLKDDYGMSLEEIIKQDKLDTRCSCTHFKNLGKSNSPFDISTWCFPVVSKHWFRLPGWIIYGQFFSLSLNLVQGSSSSLMFKLYFSTYWTMNWTKNSV